jgi:hypothetical protein
MRVGLALLFAMSLAACGAPASEAETSAQSEPDPAKQTPDVAVDTYLGDIPEGLLVFLQGTWSLKGEISPGIPQYVFEGNRVTLSYPAGGGMPSAGSDEYRPVDNCIDLNYDPRGRGVELGIGVFGTISVCWTLSRVTADEIDITVGPETLTLTRVTTP